MKTRKQIIEELEYYRESIHECVESGNYDDAKIYEGWCEALEWILDDSVTNTEGD